MATVPYQPYPTESPANVNTPELRVATPLAAFGGDVATAIGHMGEQVIHSADKLWNRAVALQEVQNKAAADQAEADYMEQAGKLHAEYNALQGEQAVAALPAHIKALKDIRANIRGTLTTPSAQKSYDSGTLSTLGRNIFNAAGHSATQNKRWAAGASSARLDQIKDYSLHNPDDERAFEDGLRQTEQEIRGTQAPIAGWGKDQTDRAVAEAKSELIASRIIGMSRTRPFIAEELLSMNRDRLHGKDLERVEKIVQSASRTTGARMISGEVGATNPDIPLDKAIAEGEAKAERMSPDDPILKDYVRQRVIADRNSVKAVKREKDFDNREVIEGAIVGGTRQGKIPSSLEELFALDPKAQGAWENLDHKDQRKYLGVLARNAKGDTAWTQEGLRKYQALKGLADEDPEKFIGTDVITENIPNSAKRELVNLQQRKRKNIEQDPRVLRALRELSPMMFAAGIDKSRDQEGYFAFRGSLQDALDDYQKRYPGKTPTSQEVQEIGSRLIQDQTDPEKWGVFGLLNRTTPLYNLTVPDDHGKAIEEAFIAEKGRKPTEEEKKRIFILKRYQELWGNKPPSVKAPRSQ